MPATFPLDPEWTLMFTAGRAAEIAEEAIEKHFLECRQMSPDCLVPVVREALIAAATVDV